MMLILPQLIITAAAEARHRAGAPISTTGFCDADYGFVPHGGRHFVRCAHVRQNGSQPGERARNESKPRLLHGGSINRARDTTAVERAWLRFAWCAVAWL